MKTLQTQIHNLKIYKKYRTVTLMAHREVQCMCVDGVLVDVRIDRFESVLLRSAAPGVVTSLPGVASGCLSALLSLSIDKAMSVSIVDLVRIFFY